MTILDEILEHKRREIAQAKAKLPVEELQRRALRSSTRRGFRTALESSPNKPALIAELKRKSPSRGMLRERFDPVSLAQQLQDAGASALSVLTDERFFGGSLEILRDVQAFVEIPVLRKDFILEPYQIYEAACAQADAVLLIVQALSEAQLGGLLRVATQVGLDALVEVHTEEERDRALECGARLIGINTRDLRTFTTHQDVVQRLVSRIPTGVVVVAESGIRHPKDLIRLKSLGVHAVLIGEALMTAPDAAAKARELFAGAWRPTAS